MEGRQTLMRALVLVLVATQTGCYFFRTRKTNSDGAVGALTRGVIGVPIGERAGAVDVSALGSIHALSTIHPPAAVRPDPDTMVRQLLLEYRDEGATVAQEIGRVEQYRMLLGGASDDFAIAPQDSYDATSMLAELKVAEEVCRGLVAPTSDHHGSWATILPAAPADYPVNIKFLAQRILGVPSDQVSDATLASLKGILDTARVGGAYTEASYVPVCATLIIDADALLL